MGPRSTGRPSRTDPTRLFPWALGRHGPDRDHADSTFLLGPVSTTESLRPVGTGTSRMPKALLARLERTGSLSNSGRGAGRQRPRLAQVDAQSDSSHDCRLPYS